MRMMSRLLFFLFLSSRWRTLCVWRREGVGGEVSDLI